MKNFNLLITLSILSTLLSAGAGCSLLGLGDQERTRCDSDSDCLAHNEALGDEACRVFRCDTALGTCVAEPLDTDADEALPMRCGGTDCDDENADIGPQIEEICGNSIDEDCDGFANDLDCDGFDSIVHDGDDCDDNDPDIHIEAAEVCGNLIDEDCDGFANDLDCDGVDAVIHDGLDCDDSDPVVHTGAEEICGNDVDEDCDGFANDLDCDGVDDVSRGGADCDDSNATIHGEADEVCGNEVDENCDGIASDLDCDGVDWCAEEGCDCDDENASIGPHVAELCNGVDDDCNGLLDGVDEDDDRDGHADACAGTVSEDCDDEDPLTFVGAEEVCDGFDNDCELDGVLRLVGGPMEEPGEDEDGDGHVDPVTPCVEVDRFGLSHFPMDDCNDSNPLVYPGAYESCDGLDNDCDGVFDNVSGSTTAGTACELTRIAAGGDHTCALRADDVVICWGDNGQGELGVEGVDTAAFDALVVDGVHGVQDLVSGDGFSCAIVADGDSTAVLCWGREQLVLGGSSSAPAFDEIDGVTGASVLDAGNTHVCAIVAGDVYCWGFSQHGQLDGDFLGDRGEGYGPRLVDGVSDVVSVEAGTSVTCALTTAMDAIHCWGSNDRGQLGTDEVTDYGLGTVTGIDDPESISCAGATCCALRRTDGSVWCWGDNRSGELGCEGEASCPSSSNAPLQVPGLTDVIALDGNGDQYECEEPGACSCGSMAYFCATLSSGDLRCWGVSESLNLRSSTPPDFCFCSGLSGGAPFGFAYDCIPAPTDSGTVPIDSEVSLGLRHGCSLTDEELICWGANDRYQLGLGFTSGEELPDEPVTVLAAATQIEGSCFRLPSLDVRCSDGESLRRPDELTHDDVVDLGVSDDHWCVARLLGQAQCYGDNSWGQLGSPMEGGLVAGVTDAVDVAVGQTHSCALRRNGHVVCWGDNRSGQLGVPDAADPSCGDHCSSVPLTVLGIGGSSEVAQLALGRAHSCVLTTDAQVYCWGENSAGQTGSPTRRDVSEPRFVASLPPDREVLSISASRWSDTTCALLDSGNVLCWGEGLAPTIPGGADPWTLAGMESVVQLAIAGGAACGRLASGAVRCIGETEYDVTRIVDAADVGCSESHCCLTRTSGQSLCFGNVPAGILGPDEISTPTPLPVVGLISGS